MGLIMAERQDLIIQSVGLLTGGAVGGALGYVIGFEADDRAGAIYWAWAGCVGGAIGALLDGLATAWLSRHVLRTDVYLTSGLAFVMCALGGVLGGIVGRALDGSAAGLAVGGLIGLGIGMMIGVGAAMGGSLLASLMRLVGMPWLPGVLAGASASGMAAWSFPAPSSSLEMQVYFLRLVAGAGGALVGSLAAQGCRRLMLGQETARLGYGSKRIPLLMILLVCGGNVGVLLTLSSLEQQLHGAPVEVTGLSLSEDGRFLLAGYHPHSSAVKTGSDPVVWDLHTGTIATRLAGSGEFVNDVSLSRDARLAVTGDLNEIHEWELPAGRKIRSTFVEVKTRVTRPSDPFGTLGTSRLYVLGVAILPDKKYAFFAAGMDATLKSDVGMWDLETGALRTYPEAHQDRLTAMSVSPDGRWALTGGKDKQLKLWEPATLNFVRSITTSDEVAAVAVSPNGQRGLSADDYLSRDLGIHIWDLPTGRSVGKLDGHGKRVTALAFLRDGRRALSASEDETVRLWDVDARVELARYHARGVMRRLAVSAQEDFFISGDARGWLCRWSLPEP
jgi:WD40 repeat protein